MDWLPRRMLIRISPSRFTALILAVIFLGNISCVLGQESTGLSETSSYTIDFTQSGQVPQHQSNVAVTSQGIMPVRQGVESYYVSFTETIPIVNARPFMAITPIADISNYDPAAINVEVRFSKDQIVWDDWTLINKSEELDPSDPRFIGEMMFVDSSYQFFQYKFRFNTTTPSLPFARVTYIRFDFFSPGPVSAVNAANVTGFTIENMNSECLCPLPNYATRSDWNCPDGNNPSCSNPAIVPVTHMVVHHSAGINNSDNWGAVVLAIWNSHVNTNGWCDIGYNWLIDPNGVVYEGRGGGNNVRGAHYCGHNSGTMGICLLGNFENVEPTSEALTSLTELLTWKSCDSDLDPTGTSYHVSSAKTQPTILGHQNGCSTLCPGNNLYNKLPLLRTNVAGALAVCSNQSTHIGRLEQDNSRISLFPNPNNGEFTLRWDGIINRDARLCIFDFQGRKVHDERLQLVTGTQNYYIKTQNLSRGVYQLMLTTSKGILIEEIQVDAW